MRNFDKIHNYHQASVNGEFIWPFFHVKSIIVYVFPLNLQIVQTITMKTFISGNFFKCLHYILCRYDCRVRNVFCSGKEV